MKKSRTPSLLVAVLFFLLTALFAAFAHAGTTSATFGWPADSATVSGYKLYWGTASKTYGTPVDAGNNTSVRITTLPAAGPIFVAVTAYDAATGSTPYAESGFSPELVGYTVSASADANSTVSPSGTIWIGSGQSQTFTITPKSGYVSVINLDGALIGLASGTSYTLSAVAGNHVVSIVSMAQIPAPGAVSVQAGQ